MRNLKAIGVVYVCKDSQQDNLKYRICVHGHETSGAFSVVECVYELGDVSDRHMHTLEGHGVYIISGEISILVDTHQLNLKTGDYLYVPPFVWHEFKILDHNTKVRITIAPAGLELLFEELNAVQNKGYESILKKYGVELADNLLS